MKTFRVEVTTKGTFEVQVAPVDTDKYDIEEIDFNEFNDILDCSDYLVTGGMGDEWEGKFEMSVYDENENVVYESNDFTDFKFITSEDDEDDLSEHAKQEIEKRIKSDIEQRKDVGMYAVRAEELKWFGFTFTVEDEEFNPDKLAFVADMKLEGLVYDCMTRPDHILYGDNFVDVECDEDYDNYGYQDSIYEMMKFQSGGYFEKVKDIE